MSGHVRMKSADFAIYRIWASFVAFWSALLHSRQHHYFDFLHFVKKACRQIAFQLLAFRLLDMSAKTYMQNDIRRIAFGKMTFGKSTAYFALPVTAFKPELPPPKKKD